MIKARGIHFSYGTRPILTDVDLNVSAGTIVGLLGPNGTGKSTLLGVLTGDLHPSAGSVELAGKDIGHYSRMELARLRSVMPQASEFPFAYLARDIVRLGRACWTGNNSHDDDAVVDRAMERTEVSALADREVTRLSGGEKARVTLARVLAQEARIVFLDEPTAALDIAHQEKTMEICVELAAAGCAVVAVMHDIQLAAAYCDQLALMSGGSIAACGPPAEVITGELLTQVYEHPITVATLDNGEIVILPQRLATAQNTAARALD